VNRRRFAARLAWRSLLPLTATGAALAALSALRVQAWSTTGDALSLAQRDVRIHDAFTAAAANANQAADPSFPGAAGAALAIWKAAVEWGSERHGWGGGDPSQPNGLGSGGANYDPSWQGLATSAGGVNDNIHAPITGLVPGVYAYCETPSSDGWRIRYYQGWNWSGGPGTTLANGEVDLQGVATHEHGHALGLAHSSTAGATMVASASGSLIGLRSIESDDASGIAAIYGSKSAGKPRILGVTVEGAALTLHGNSFSASSNEVWFTRRASGDGTPVKLSGLASSAGGTRLDCTIPAAAGPGDVLLKVPGSVHACLSNAWPLDTDHAGASGGPPVLLGVSPTTLATVSSAAPTLSFTGSGLAGLSSVMVDGTPLAAGQWNVSGDSALSVSLGLPLSVGALSIRVTNALGTSAPWVVPVAAADPPALALSSKQVYSAMPLSLWVGAPPGTFVWLCVSPDASPTQWPGIVDLSIGAAGTSLFLVGTQAVGASGACTRSLPLAALPFGTILHFQAATLLPGSGLPLTATAAQSCTFYF
jgi:hypothetical protein